MLYVRKFLCIDGIAKFSTLNCKPLDIWLSLWHAQCVYHKRGTIKKGVTNSLQVGPLGDGLFQPFGADMGDFPVEALDECAAHCVTVRVDSAHRCYFSLRTWSIYSVVYRTRFFSLYIACIRVIFSL